MSLMFFISGLFVYPALRKHGTFRFIRDRLRRLGIPFAFALVILMPIAYYASWQLSSNNNGFLDFYKRLAAKGFDAGPPWFIWVLLLLDTALALVAWHLRHWMPKAGRLMTRLQERPFTTFVVSSFFRRLRSFRCSPYTDLAPGQVFHLGSRFRASAFTLYGFRSAFWLGPPGLPRDSWPVVAGWRGTGRIGWLDAYWPITRYVCS
jgi:hypothetical protein